jgi:Zn-dependent peptidase ImmA (M78 family)
MPIKSIEKLIAQFDNLSEVAIYLNVSEEALKYRLKNLGLTTYSLMEAV